MADRPPPSHDIKPPPQRSGTWPRMAIAAVAVFALAMLLFVLFYYP